MTEHYIMLSAVIISSTLLLAYNIYDKRKTKKDNKKSLTSRSIMVKGGRISKRGVVYLNTICQNCGAKKPVSAKQIALYGMGVFCSLECRKEGGWMKVV